MATEKQIAANKRNAEKSTGPRTEQGKARSRMNALRHGLSSVVPETFVSNGRVFSADNSRSMRDAQIRLGQIYLERVKIFGMIDENLKLSDAMELHITIQRLAALERYSRRGYSELQKYTRTPDKKE